MTISGWRFCSSTTLKNWNLREEFKNTKSPILRDFFKDGHYFAKFTNFCTILGKSRQFWWIRIFKIEAGPKSHCFGIRRKTSSRITFNMLTSSNFKKKLASCSMMEKIKTRAPNIFLIFGARNVFDVSSPQKLFDEPSLTEVALNQLAQIMASQAPERE